MPASRRSRTVLFLLLAGHVLAACLGDYFGVVMRPFGWWRTATGIGAAGRTTLTMGMLGLLAADAGLLGVWAALAPFGRTTRWLSAAVCLACWFFTFRGESPREFWRQSFWQFGILEPPNSSHLYKLLWNVSAVAGLSLLIVVATASGIAAISRRGARLTRQSSSELRAECFGRQFEVSHLLILSFVVSLLLAQCANFRSWFSPHISMQWRWPAEAPVYCAETVLITGLIVTVITLSQLWAVLTLGGPWLRLVLSWVSAGVLGLAWAFTFTSPVHREHLFWNGAFSTGATLIEALLTCLALLYVRRRGYRLVRRRGWHDESAALSVAPPRLT